VHAQRLRVVDASIMPRLIGGNTNAPQYCHDCREAAMMLAHHAH
jgi:choline dehydrogenase-like flavoprotein